MRNEEEEGGLGIRLVLGRVAFKKGIEAKVGHDKRRGDKGVCGIGWRGN